MNTTICAHAAAHVVKGRAQSMDEGPRSCRAITAQSSAPIMPMKIPSVAVNAQHVALAAMGLTTW